MRVLDADAMRQVDRRAIEEIGIPSLVLMENAAIGAVDAIAEVYPDATSVAIFCGPGNNGGDGLAMARHLTIRGYEVEVNLVTTGTDLSGDAGLQLEICRKQHLSIRDCTPETSLRAALDSAAQMDLIVDALFGTGLSRPLEGYFAEVVSAINSLPVVCVAVDLPSGLDGSKAGVPGPHVQAELTVTFAAPKVPHILSPAATAVGDVVVADLGIPTDLVSRAPGNLNLLTKEDVTGHLPPRAAETHKGDFGHAVIVAGSMGKAGAAILAARGAVRAGSGLVTVATPRSIAQTVDLGSVESMTLPLEEEPEGGLSEASVETVLSFVQGKQALALGPGLGTDAATVRVVQSIVAGAEVPVVLDADGLNAYAGAVDRFPKDGPSRILTPHPGELARLLEMSAAEIQQDRVSSVVAAAEQTRSVIVLKGHQSLIAEPGGAVFVSPTGNPGMATGGTGDVLTGILVGLLSQGLEVTIAARVGTYLHGFAGDLCESELGQEGLAAGDLLRRLPEAFSSILP